MSRRAKHVEVMVQAAVAMGPSQATAKRVRAAKREERKRLLAGKGDVGTPELAKRHELVDHSIRHDGYDVTVKRNVTAEPFDVYKARGHITPAQWRAGNKLRKLYDRTGLQARITAGYQPDRVDSSAKAWDIVTTAQSEAQAEYNDTIRSLGVLASIVSHVACHGGSATDWAASRFGKRGKHAERTGMTALHLGLDQLALLQELRRSVR